MYDRRPKDQGSRETHYHDLKKVRSNQEPLINNMDRMEKRVQRMDESRDSVLSGSGENKFFKNVVIEKKGRSTFYIMYSMHKNKALAFQSFTQEVFTNQLKLINTLQDVTRDKLQAREFSTVGKNLILIALSMARADYQDQAKVHSF